MKKSFFVLLAAGSLNCIVTPALAQFDISTSTGLFDPSYRAQANTTWFGWGSGSFDGTNNNEIIDNPLPTIGVNLAGVSFIQSPATNDILSGSDNIYTAGVGETTLTLGIPTSGTAGSGFTTIIIQGRTAFGPYQTALGFGTIAGVSPTFVVGPNAATTDQFWAKYEIPGNAANYNLDVVLGAASFTSIGELEIDTLWSATGFASDMAVVPEPSTWALLAAGVVIFGTRLRSRKS